MGVQDRFIGKTQSPVRVANSILVGSILVDPATLRCLMKEYTRLFNFRNFDTLPGLIRAYLRVNFVLI